jgi:Tol biopolymer transport system component
MADDGSDIVQLTTAGGDPLWPIWSPDGERIAFTSMRDGNPEVYVMDQGGFHQRRLTHTDAEEKWVSWAK